MACICNQVIREPIARLGVFILLSPFDRLSMANKLGINKLALIARLAVFR